MQKRAAVLPRRVCCLKGLKHLSKRLEETLWTTVRASRERRHTGHLCLHGELLTKSRIEGNEISAPLANSGHMLVKGPYGLP